MLCLRDHQCHSDPCACGPTSLPQGAGAGLAVPTQLPLLWTSLSHLHGLQAPSYSAVSLNHHLKLTVTSCMEATGVEKMWVLPKVTQLEGHPPFHCGRVQGSGLESTHSGSSSLRCRLPERPLAMHVVGGGTWGPCRGCRLPNLALSPGSLIPTFTQTPYTTQIVEATQTRIF